MYNPRTNRNPTDRNLATSSNRTKRIINNPKSPVKPRLRYRMLDQTKDPTNTRRQTESDTKTHLNKEDNKGIPGFIRYMS